MKASERRKGASIPVHVLERQLNDAQRLTLRELERFGLSLAFVRRPMFQPAIGVVQDSSRRSFVVIEPDGSVTDKVDLKLRH